MSRLPVVDLTQLHATSTTRTDALAELARICRDVGFFYLTGHGLSQAQLDAMLTLGRDFFALPDSEKRAIQMRHSPHFRGYSGIAAELTRGRPDQREQFDIMREESAAATRHAPWQGLIGPNQWPAAMPQLKPTLLAFQQQLSDLAQTLLTHLLASLELPSDALANTYQAGPYLHTKLLRYPAVPNLASPHEAQRQGVGAHKDPGYLTFVLGDSEAGLEVETDAGWLLVEPLPGALVVNIGELLELATDGYLKATTHRVTSPGTRDRYSLAFFMAAQLDAQVPVLQLPDAFKALTPGISTDPDNPLLRDVGMNTLKGRLRSHPDVAAAHYSELDIAANGTSSSATRQGQNSSDAKQGVAHAA
ncbi:MAG TPA: 2-oxobutyrate oxidase [Rheinheimera sp.]|nr:2-oxobutyrate oxidase [Rheinheimera sp.]